MAFTRQADDSFSTLDQLTVVINDFIDITINDEISVTGALVHDDTRVTRVQMSAVGENADTRVTRIQMAAVGENANTWATRATMFVVANAAPTPPPAEPDNMPVPSGAVYLDVVTEDPLTGSSTPILINAFPYDEQAQVPAADAGGSHPIHLTVADIGANGLAAGQTTIDVTVGSASVSSALVESSSTVTVFGLTVDVVIDDSLRLEDQAVTVGAGIIDVTIEDEISMSDRVVSGIVIPAFNGTVFAADWDTDSTYVAIASDGGGTVDEHRFKLIRERAFGSLEVVQITLHSETTIGEDLDVIYDFTIEDLTAPLLTKVETLGLKTLRITFDEPMEQGSGDAGDALLVRDISGGAEVAAADGVNPARIITARTLFTADDVGRFIGVAGAENAINNGIFTVVALISPTTVEISNTLAIAEDLPVDTVISVAPYRVEGIADASRVSPYFEPLVVAAEAVDSQTIELTLHAEITQTRLYRFHAVAVSDVYGNVIA